MPEFTAAPDQDLFDAAELTAATREAYLGGVRDGETAGLVVGRRAALAEVSAAELDRRRRRLVLVVEGAAVGLGWVLGSLLAQAAQDGAR